MTQRKHKKARSFTTSTCEATSPKDAQDRKDICCYFTTITVDVFKEITSLLVPGDILALARVNKFLRRLLMHRSAAHIWRSTEKNVEMLPPCPRHLSHPRYAALVFTNNCSGCGISVMRQLDEDLSVRLCNACRNTYLVGNSQIPSEVLPYVPLSYIIKNPSRANNAYALREDVQRICSELMKLPVDEEHLEYKRWNSKRRRRLRERKKHSMALLRYTNMMEVRRDDEFEDKRLQRRADVMSRLLKLGWKDEDMNMMYPSSEKSWNDLMALPKPLTDRSWERLYPKFLRLLKLNRKHRHNQRRYERRRARYDLVKQLLSDIKASAQPCIELEEHDSSATAAKGTMRLPYPVLIEVLDRYVFKDLSHTDRSLEATRAKFDASRGLIDNALSKWRAALEYELVKMLRDGREAQRREVPAVNGELISESTSLSTRFSAHSYNFISARNSILFRADSVFRFREHQNATFYPQALTLFADAMDGPIDFTSPKAANFTPCSLMPSRIEYHAEGARIARALLRALGRPDAAYAEMHALGSRFSCGRCYRPPDTWDRIIDHYWCEHKQWASYDTSKSHLPDEIAYNDLHCLEYQSNRPLVKLTSPQELANYDQRYLTTFEDCFECRLCGLLKLSYVVLGSRKSIVLHLRHVHNILQPKFGEDYVQPQFLYGDIRGLLEGSDVTPIIEE
ncbi:hypothetical protein BDV93DRAFT_272896 [Ceratobasidium sp. AG-I]|nr:hypothetical protein BDV93DRAFT_272896 [Ceratobasidium sp. AG-I]